MHDCIAARLPSRDRVRRLGAGPISSTEPPMQLKQIAVAGMLAALCCLAGNAGAAGGSILGDTFHATLDVDGLSTPLLSGVAGSPPDDIRDAPPVGDGILRIDWVD